MTAQGRRTIAESILSQLEIGLTFLELAANAIEPRHVLHNINHALAALSTADNFMPRIEEGSRLAGMIEQCREQLTVRLRATGRDVL